MNREMKKQGEKSEEKSGRRVPLARPGRAAWIVKTNRRLRLLRGVMTLLCAAVLLLGLLLLILPCFKVKEIKVTGELGITKLEEVQAATGVEIGDEVIGLDPNAIMKNVKEKCPNIIVDRVSVTPFAVKLTVRARASLYMEYAGKWFSLDRDLQVLSVSDDETAFEGLLKVRLPDIAGVTVGSSVTFLNSETDRSYITTMLELLDELALTDRVNLLDVSEKFNVSYVVDGSTRIVLGKVSDLTVKLEMAEQILLARDGASEFAVVDVSDCKKSTYRPMSSFDMLMAG